MAALRKRRRARLGGRDDELAYAGPSPIHFLQPSLGAGFAGVGILSTLVMTLYTWRRRFELEPAPFVIAVLGIFAAGASVAWHSHIHSAVILIPPLRYLYQAKILPQKVLNYWVYLPSFLFVFTVFIPPALIRLNLSISHLGSLLDFLVGASEFGVTFFLLWWAIQVSHRDALGRQRGEDLFRA
jgi:hypothetical protein